MSNFEDGNFSGHVSAQSLEVFGPAVFHGGITNPLPPYPVPEIRNTLLVGPGPGEFPTLDAAARTIPNPYPPGNRYFIDLTNDIEALTPGYKLPAWKGPEVTELDLLSPDFIYMAGVNISATPRLTTLLSVADATIPFADIVSQVVDPITEKLTITVAPPRLAWGVNLLAGKQAQGSAGPFDNGGIYENTTTTLVVQWPFPLTAGPAITIVEPSAYLTGTQIEDFAGALTAFNSDSLSLRGISVKDSAGGYGLSMSGAGVGFAQRCELESPSFDMGGNASSANRVAKNWITGFPYFSGPLFLPHNFFDQCTGGMFWSAPIIPDIVGCVFDGCDPVDFLFFTPGVGFGAFADATAAVDAMNLSTTIFKNGTGDAIRFHGACGVLQNCDFFGNAGNAVVANLGNGLLEIKNCITSGAPNGGFGVRGDDGIKIKVDAATSGALTPLTGVGGDMSIGNRAPRTWADFVSGASGIPALEELDLTVIAGLGGTVADAALAPAYITGTGTRLYQ